MADAITPFLMFQDHQAEQAMNFYVSLFPDSQVVRTDRYGESDGELSGQLRVGEFTLRGRRFMCFNSPIEHAFEFTPSVSLHVTCQGREEIDRLFAKLSDGGEVMMPLQEYPFSRRYAWLNDRFGVSWQLTLESPPDAR